MSNIEIKGNTINVNLTGKHAVKSMFINTLRKLDIGPKYSYQEILGDMMDAYIAGMKVEDVNTGSVMSKLLEAMGDSEEDG